MNIKEMKEKAKLQIESNIDYLKKPICKDKVEEYNMCIYYLLDLCLTTELITYEEFREYKKRCLDIINCPFDI